MNNQMSRAELVAYARAENIANHFGAPSEALDTLGDYWLTSAMKCIVR